MIFGLRGIILILFSFLRGVFRFCVCVYSFFFKDIISGISVVVYLVIFGKSLFLKKVICIGIRG